jgi:hypothetical protein
MLAYKTEVPAMSDLLQDVSLASLEERIYTYTYLYFNMK